MSKTKENYVGTSRAYYRYQEDRQRVIQRNEEQQRIVNEYFIVKNKKKYNLVLIIVGIVALLAGVILLCCGLGAKSTNVGGDSSKDEYPGISSLPGYKPDDSPSDKKGSDGATLITIGAVFALVGLTCGSIVSKTVKYTPDKFMTDEEYEALVDKRISAMDIKQFGLDQLGIDAEEIKDVAPLVFTDNAFTEGSFRVYNPQTKRVHSSTKYVTYIYFTDKQVLTYTITFDMCCNEQTEETNELFYHDVCDVTSTIKRNVIDLGSTKFEYSEIGFSVISSNASITVAMSGDNERLSSVQAMKQKIRERKVQ